MATGTSSSTVVESPPSALRHYIPLLGSTLGAATLAIHLVAACNIQGPLIAVVILLACFAAGMACAHRIEAPTILKLGIATLASVVIHIALLHRWMGATELFEGFTSSAPLAAVTLLGAWLGVAVAHRRRLRASGLANMVATVVLVAATQPIFGHWPLSLTEILLVIFAAQVIVLFSQSMDDSGPAGRDVLGCFLGSIVALAVMHSPWFESGLHFCFVAVSLVSATLLAVVISFIAVHFAEGLTDERPAKRVKLPAAWIRRKPR